MATPLVAMLLRASVGVAGTRERWVWRPMSAGGCESWDMKCVVVGVSWAVFLRKNPCPGKRCPCARPDASHSVVLSSARWCVSWRRVMSYGSRDASKKRRFLGSAKPLTFRERQRNVDGGAGRVRRSLLPAARLKGGAARSACRRGGGGNGVWGRRSLEVGIEDRPCESFGSNGRLHCTARGRGRWAVVHEG